MGLVRNVDPGGQLFGETSVGLCRAAVVPAAASSSQRKLDRGVSSGALLCGETWHAASQGVMLSIPCGAVHRARADDSDLLILEVQHGVDLREDDIERLQDDYGRVIT